MISEHGLLDTGLPRVRVRPTQAGPLLCLLPVVVLVAEEDRRYRSEDAVPHLGSSRQPAVNKRPSLGGDRLGDRARQMEAR